MKIATPKPGLFTNTGTRSGREHIVPPRLTQNSLVQAVEILSKRDPDLARLAHRHGPPPLWERPQGFRTLIQIILEQQVSLASAKAMLYRLSARITPFTPEQFLSAGVSYLRDLGLTRQKTAYCIHLAEAIVRQELDLDALALMNDQAVSMALTQIKGIGPWTAQIYLLMALLRPDIWPSGDIALAESFRRVKALKTRPSNEALAAHAESWRPYRAVAARMLWHHYLS
ncbi:MAG: DNA-3-methyladenine glycosylase family protein, partial [Nitrospiria bacterium]